MIDANESNFYMRKTHTTVNFSSGECYVRWVLPAESFTSGEVTFGGFQFDQYQFGEFKFDKFM